MRSHTAVVVMALILGLVPTTTTPLPDWVKTAASVAYTTASKSSATTREEVFSGTLPSSTQRLWGTACAATCATLVTNRICATTKVYRTLNRASQRILKRYPSIPAHVRPHIMPALTMAASSILYTALFHTLQEPACLVEKEVTHVLKNEEMPNSLTFID